MPSATSGITFSGIAKRFPGVVALDDVSFEIAGGTCHALCGENGAGKSTLGKILAGSLRPDSGQVLRNGHSLAFSSPTHALAAGVAMVHQELAFCENLSVEENLCLGLLPSRSGLVDRRTVSRLATDMLSAIECPLDLKRKVGDLTIGQQQLLQIAGAIGRGASVIVFDEPTSSLSQHEAARLYRLVDQLRARGVTCVYVTHRLEEVFQLCNAVTVLRDGRHVATAPIASMNRDRLVEMMIGRAVDNYFPSHNDVQRGPELLRVDGFSSPSKFQDVSLSVHAGEIVGLAGLVGAGRSELALAVFGLDDRATGTVRVRGQLVKKRSPAVSIALGLGLVPEDRKRRGLILTMSALSNATLSILRRLARMGIVTRTAESRGVAAYFNQLRVRSSRSHAPVAELSGGNQQKVVLTKWLAAECEILFIDEPTRGIDIGAKAEIHALIGALAAKGTAVVLISSEMPEILNLSNRIVVFREGRIVGELSRPEATPDALMRLMAGVAA